MSGAEAVYGFPPPVLAEVGTSARQVSPLIPGAAAIEDIADESLARMVVLAPPGVLERRYVLAQALRALEPRGELVALAPKTRGGARLNDELTAFGCEVRESAKRHHRICVTEAPATPLGLAEAIAEAGPQRVGPEGFWSQPGVFSWNRLDPGSAVLLAAMPPLSGRGADLGCGSGILGREVLRLGAVSALWLLDIDGRAVAAARRNIIDERAVILHADARAPHPDLTGLDFVIMNPPFHVAGEEDRRLGPAFIEAAARMLRRGGVCRLVANVALPYEAHLATNFSRFSEVARANGFKVFEAVR
jgi:16S rRNA (guanine1207-N2)-methyltransferase